MARRPRRVQEDLPKYYDRRGVLREIETGPVEFALVHYRCERFRLSLTLRKE